MKLSSLSSTVDRERAVADGGVLRGLLLQLDRNWARTPPGNSRRRRPRTAGCRAAGITRGREGRAAQRKGQSHKDNPDKRAVEEQGGVPSFTRRLIPACTGHGRPARATRPVFRSAGQRIARKPGSALPLIARVYSGGARDDGASQARAGAATPRRARSARRCRSRGAGREWPPERAEARARAAPAPLPPRAPHRPEASGRPGRSPPRPGRPPPREAPSEWCPEPAWRALEPPPQRARWQPRPAPRRRQGRRPQAPWRGRAHVRSIPRRTASRCMPKDLRAPATSVSQLVMLPSLQVTASYPSRPAGWELLSERDRRLLAARSGPDMRLEHVRPLAELRRSIFTA